MFMNNRDAQIIKKILLEIDIIEELVNGFDFEKFIDHERTKRAVCMTLINIGELVKNLTEDFKFKYSCVPWREIAGMRDITAHKYQTLKMGDVWFTTENDIPILKDQLNNILKKLSE
jgi:uncharacterized protein with HEPN domain